MRTSLRKERVVAVIDERGAAAEESGGGSIRTLIPARLDRIGWSNFHTTLVVALGMTWVLDGLEITIASNVTSLISRKQSLNLSSAGVAFAVGTVYLLGEVFGALLFGYLSDRWGHRNLFMVHPRRAPVRRLPDGADVRSLDLLGVLALHVEIRGQGRQRW
jgi:hypothetical protein